MPFSRGGGCLRSDAALFPRGVLWTPAEQPPPRATDSVVRQGLLDLQDLKLCFEALGNSTLKPKPLYTLNPSQLVYGIMFSEQGFKVETWRDRLLYAPARVSF